MWSPPRSPVVIFFYKVVLIFLQITFTIWSRLYILCFTINEYISAITKYHHRTPQIIKRDVGKLKKIPHHLAIILEYKKDGGLELLIHQVAELSCWCVSSGIKILTIYEKEGRMKEYQSVTHRTISQRLQSYFGRSRHNIKIRSPYVSVFSSDDVSNDKKIDYPVGKKISQATLIMIIKHIPRP
ncbi:hypothetical protein PORY_001732 [Pneumocystis oryctolagi]|uniref:Uncharacterized protein n=1 Tax=Pneumocystis oryctolagi TaxID=42067 RepID=A0ACB7CBE8_9ASCO|nr:hypothetical protein PORY_001732 [Pneumocystis oryctolagi]